MDNVVLLTRIGLTVFRNGQNWHVNPNGLQNITDIDTYMEYVLDLFERFTLPCMMNQTDNNFTWLILTDSMITQEYLDKLNTYKKLVPNIEVIFGDYTKLDRDISLRRCYTPFIPESGKCITARLDADDLVSPDWIAWIRACAEKWDHGVVYSPRVPKMYLVDETKELLVEDVVKVDKRPLSATALIEPNAKSFLGVHCVNHKNLGCIAPLLKLPKVCSARTRSNYTVSLIRENLPNKTINRDKLLRNRFNLDLDQCKVIHNVRDIPVNVQDVQNVGSIPKPKDFMLKSDKVI